jgi:PPOX class probable F420-dependent enzyme
VVGDEVVTAALRDSRRAVLGTLDPDGRAHLVPVAFVALPGGEIVTAVDQKPKATRHLKRLSNIERDPRVTLLIDEYDDDWSRLWWIRVDGEARVTESAPAGALQALMDKYRNYRDAPPLGPWITIEPVKVTRWSAT